MIVIETEIFYPKNKMAWREWLQKNHLSKESIWLLFYKKATNAPTLTWSEAVDEALCFGWIDSIRKTRDSESSLQFFSKRKAKSTWSRVNKAKIEVLTEKKFMQKAGLESVEIAKKNNSWTILDEVEALIIPKDLELALLKITNGINHFLSLSKSVKKAMLHRLVFAKREETRLKRIEEIIEAVAKK